MMDIVDYSRMWRVWRKKQTNPSFNWDKRAASFNKVVSGTSDEVEKTIGLLGLLPTDTVLDMGAGTGRYAVCLAQHAAHVTALEPSKGMLAFLEEHMADAGITNYSVVNKTLEDTEIGTDLPVHDVVFASNSIGFDDLRAGLEKLNAAARKSVHILWFAGPARHTPDPELMQRLGTDLSAMGAPDYIIIANVLHQMGIYANISVEKTVRNQIYVSPDEAADFWIERGNYPDEMQDVIREYMKETLIPDENGRFPSPRTYHAARIWWEKEDARQ